jgi:hypothetical protein
MHFNQIHNILYKTNRIHIKEHNIAQYEILMQRIKIMGCMKNPIYDLRKIGFLSVNIARNLNVQPMLCRGLIFNLTNI